MRNLLFVLLFCPLFLQAQDSVKVSLRSPTLIAKFSPYSLIDLLSSVQFALEHQLGTQAVSLQHELGYVRNILYWEDDFKNVQGLRLRNELRFYLQPQGINLQGPYFAPEFLFIHFRYKKTADFGQGCEGSSFGCNYYKTMDYAVQQQVYAFHLKFGHQSFYKRWTYDFYTGAGYRYVQVRNIDKPPHEVGDSWFFNLRKRAGVYNLPSLSLGFKIGYIL